jgi:hypothetical protein
MKSNKSGLFLRLEDLMGVMPVHQFRFRIRSLMQTIRQLVDINNLLAAIKSSDAKVVGCKRKIMAKIGSIITEYYALIAESKREPAIQNDRSIQNGIRRLRSQIRALTA